MDTRPLYDGGGGKLSKLCCGRRRVPSPRRLGRPLPFHQHELRFSQRRVYARRGPPFFCVRWHAGERDRAGRRGGPVGGARLRHRARALYGWVAKLHQQQAVQEDLCRESHRMQRSKDTRVWIGMVESRWAAIHPQRVPSIGHQKGAALPPTRRRVDRPDRGRDVADRQRRLLRAVPIGCKLRRGDWP